MSYDEHLREQKKKGGRKSTDVGSRLARLGQGARPEARADWGDVHPERLQHVVLACTRLGGAVSFGLSRDKGAFNLTIFLDGDRRTIWLRPDEPVEEKLLEVALMLDQLE